MSGAPDVIRLLPDSVANQIAAGEVIQRPASVIKELVENSIDAGATAVKIIVRDAGRTLIQVVDNGKGMSPTDLRIAFDRHATSKISSADDLATLHTMGFRGEALPSIAAVARVEARSMRPGDTVGSRLILSESRFESQEPCAATPGTNIQVKDLFFHMPARRKFLKNDSVELSHIVHEFERLALVNTQVEFTLIHNEITLHQLLGGSLKQRITALFGKALGSQIVPVATKTTIVEIDGFVGLPQNSRKRGAPQYLFVNGRNMRHPYFRKAILSCYADLISPEVQPAYFINFRVDPSTIDVNIHPQKHEIKFQNEQPIWQILTAAVKQSLGRVNAAGAIDFDAETVPDIPAFVPDRTAQMPGISTDNTYNPFDEDRADKTDSPAESPAPAATTWQPPHRDYVPRDWDSLYKSFTSRRDTPLTPDAEVPQPEVPDTEAAGQPGQQSLFDETPISAPAYLSVGGRFLVAPAPRGMMIIERRRAHIAILFHRFMNELSEHPLASQRLIFPETLTLTPDRSAVISSIDPLLRRLGFDVSFLGDCTWAINAVPSLPGNISPADALSGLVNDILETGEVPDENLLKPAALALARSAAIRPGQNLSAEEADSLIASLLSLPHPGFTPDGLKTLEIVDTERLAKLFGS